MKKLHIALSTDNIEASIKDYSKRLACEPCSTIVGEYALWRTDTINLSIRQDKQNPSGSLRHLGWEDPAADDFTQDTDVNGIVWERFNAQSQADEINDLWPQAHYSPEN